MTTISQHAVSDTTSGRPARAVPIISALGGLLGGGAGLALLFTNPLGEGGDGAAVTAALVDSAGLLQGLAFTGVYAAAALVVPSVVLGRHLGGAKGRIVAASGAAVALLLAAYLTTFGAGAVVGSLVLDSAGAGLGESTLVAVNVVDLTRIAPSLALVAAAVAARTQLPRPVWWSAAFLLVLLVVPLTAWFAAIVVPLWLGLAGAAVTARR